MKIKLCPDCGKENEKSVWNCVDCGRTLSLNTLIDKSAIKFGDSLSGSNQFSNISEYFRQDLIELLDNLMVDKKSIIHAYNIAIPSKLPPFKFGYVLLSREQIICVLFASDLKRDSLSTSFSFLNPFVLFLKEAFDMNVIPKRNYYKLGTHRDIGSYKFINYPQYPLTPEEEASREIITHDLINLISVSCWWFYEFLEFRAIFRVDSKFSLTFYVPYQAKDVAKFLVPYVHELQQS